MLNSIQAKMWKLFRLLIQWDCETSCYEEYTHTVSPTIVLSSRSTSITLHCVSVIQLSHFPGFEKPSAIQQRSILPIVKGRDVIAQAQSGTGKTATFSISILQSLDTTLRETQVLILSPTRELATQIQKVILALGDFMNVQCHACIGGTNLGEDIRKLDYGQHVVSGTPGRVFGKLLFGIALE